MRPTYGLSNNQMRALSRDKRGLERGGENKVNLTQEYDRIRKKAYKALEYLTFLAERDYLELEPTRYESILPPKLLKAFLEPVIVGHTEKKTNNTRRRDADLYGAILAVTCARICLAKLAEEYNKAVSGRMTKEQTHRLVNDGGTRMLYVKDFEDKAHALGQLFDVVLDEVRQVIDQTSDSEQKKPSHKNGKASD